eukprot:7377417-Prymnesium_polylepis.1
MRVLRWSGSFGPSRRRAIPFQLRSVYRERGTRRREVNSSKVKCELAAGSTCMRDDERQDGGLGQYRWAGGLLSPPYATLAR